MKRLAILISNQGTGTNLQAIIDAIEAKKLQARINVVISDTIDSPGLLRAKKHRLQIAICPKKEQLLSLLNTYRIDFVCLAGWKQIVADSVIEAFPKRILNTHPGLIPDKKRGIVENPDGTKALWNKGKLTTKAIQNFLDQNATYAGCTNHFLTDEFDFGPVNGRVFEKIKSNDTVESLYSRLKGKENKLYVDVLKRLCNKNKTFLSLPVPFKYVITEGWIYSKQENSIHGMSKHHGIDYACPRNTKVFAAASGWAFASYGCKRPFINKEGQEVLYQGKKITCSRGRFVHIYHPENNYWTEYYHLEKVAHNIPFIPPAKDGDSLLPIGNNMSPNEYAHHKNVVWVERGDIIGFIGDSGLTWGYTDYPRRPDPKKFPSWDETHLHFRVFTKNKNSKEISIDPYDIYRNFNSYPWPSHKKSIGKNHLWLRIDKGLPQQI